MSPVKSVLVNAIAKVILILHRIHIAGGREVSLT